MVLPTASNSINEERGCYASRTINVVYDVPIGQQTVFATGVSGSRKTQYSSQSYTRPSYDGRNIHCFVGQEDEFVVAASADLNLYVWSLPTDQQVEGDQIVDQSLVVLRGLTCSILSVRYNRQSDTLASAGAEKVIKLWTPIAQR